MAPINKLTSEWQFSAELTVAGEIIRDWDAIDGGDTTSATRSYRPGGKLLPEVIAAPGTTGDITLERAYRGTYDGSLRNRLASEIGSEVNLKVNALDEGGNVVNGTGERIGGVLKEVTRPAFRSENDGVALYRVVVTPSGNWAGA
jgi:hypothetical protein